ncbi:MAG TPA: DUF1565 domain-containing protein, partial [Candidatus Micrarchaeota archaeon]|nr:DUF1565 domain-containing protein [Candidatus Micrarchaeota archaeon]
PSIEGDNSSRTVHIVAWTSAFSSVFNTTIGNLTFTVDGFSGYNITDSTPPTIISTNPANLSSTSQSTPSINVTLNGTGTPISSAYFYMDNALVAAFNSTNTSAGCGPLANESEVYVCQFLQPTALAIGVHNLTITAYDYGNLSGNMANATISFTVSASNIVYVNASGSDSNPGTANSPFLTIQKGIDSVARGGTVTVAAGTYNETAVINKSLTLQSASGAAATNITGYVNITASNVTLSGFSITNPTGLYAIYLPDGVAMQNNVLIQNNIVSNVGGTSGADALPSYNKGIGIQQGENVTIQGNTISNIFAKSVGATHYSAMGIAIGDGSDALKDTITISGNNISDVFYPGPYGWNSTVKSGGAYGISLSRNTTNLTITNNAISNLEGFWAHAIGLELNTPGAIVTGNTITNLTDHKGGIDSMALRLESNPGAPTVTLSGNTFDGKPMTLATSNVVVDGTWTTSGITTGLGANTYPEVLSGSSYYYFGINAFSNISSAVAGAASGATVSVAAGTYNETAVINKSLTLQSASGAAATNITGYVNITASNVTLSGFSITNPTGLYAIYLPDGVAMQNNVLIQNNIVSNVGGTSGADALPSYNKGIGIQQGENVTIQGNTISNIFAKSVGATHYSAMGIAIGDGSDALKDTITISGNNISDVFYPGPYGWNSTVKSGGAYGISLSRNTTNLTITNNAISNLEGFWAHAIGLELNTPGAIVTGNTITNLTDHKGGIDSMALRLESNPGAPTVTLSGNTFDGKPMTLATSNVVVDGTWTTSGITTGLGANTYPEVLSGSSYYYFGINAFSNVTGGVNAVDSSGTVNVSAGNYSETVVINKSLTLAGANAGIDARGTRGAESIISSNNATGSIQVSAANGVVNIDGFTISGSPAKAIHVTGSTQTVNVRNVITEASSVDGINLYQAISGTVENNWVKGALTSGITAGSTSSPTILSQLTIRNNKVQSSAYGITGYLNNSLILNNSVLGDGNSATTLSGIGGQLLNTQIINNTVANYSFFVPGTAAAAGISLGPETGRLNTTNITMSGNTLSGNTLQFYVNQTVSAQTALIYGNSITGAVAKDVYYDTSGSGSFNVTRNYWGSADYSTINAMMDSNAVFLPYYTDSGMTKLSNQVTPTVTIQAPATGTTFNNTGLKDLNFS